MTDPAYAFAIGDYVPIVADPASDSDAKPQQGSISATVTLTPILQSGDVILATGASPRPKGFIPVPIVGRIDTDGIVKLRVDPDEGSTHGYPYQPIMILCDTPLLELDGPLFYRVTFSNVIFGGKPGKINSFEFQAPTVDGAVVNLITVGRVPGQPAPGITRGPVGASGASGASGATGPVGATGPTGATGASGVPGGVTSLNGSTGAITGVMTVTGAQTPQNKTFTDPSNTWPAFIKRSIDTVTAPRVLGASGAVDCVTLVDMRGDIAVLRLDGASGSTTITDSSPVASNWTAVGNAAISTAQSKWGGSSIYFDGTGDYITPSANNLQFSFGTGHDFTIEFWARPTGALTVVRDWISWNAEGVNAPQYLSIVSKADGNIAVYTNNYKITGTVPLTTNTWYHIALCRSGGNTRLFVDGVQAGSTLTADTQSYVCPGAGRPRFGAGGYYENAAGNNFIGFMDDIRITKGYGRYAANFTPPTGPVADEITEPAATAVGTVALLHGNGASGSVVMTDSGCLLSNWTANGNAQISTDQSRFGGSSIYFNGAFGSYLASTAPSANFTFGTSDFCIEAFVRPTASAAAVKYLVDFRVTNGAYPCLLLDSSNVLLYNVNSATRITGTTLSDDTWYHIAVTRSGTSTKLWVDGIQRGSTYTDSTDYLNPSPQPYVGQSFKGWVEELRIKKGAAVYTSGFTPPTNPHPDAPALRLPDASGHTIQHTLKNVAVPAFLLAPPTGQTIDGATGVVSIPADTTKRYVPDPAGTGWRSI